MRIGIIGSGYEGALLASWIPEGHEVHCFLDRAWWPWTSKSRDDVVVRVERMVIEAERAGMDHIIVPPVFEAHCKRQNERILPLFSTYLLNSVLPGSRVGKIGLMSVSGMAWISHIKSALKEIAVSYGQTDYQNKTQAFDPKFPTRAHDMSHRTLHLPYAKKRSWMMRNLIKHDLRHFKNDDVDTLVPCDRGMLYREVMIRHRLGARMKFHGSKAVREVIVGLLWTVDGWADIPPCFLYCSADPEVMMNDKNWKQLFDRWGKREVVLATTLLLLSHPPKHQPTDS
jgi:hypothetical protein